MVRFATIVLLLAAVPAAGQIIRYEGDVFPEDAGWQRIERPFVPERWLEDGWLRLRSKVVDPENCVGDDEFYRWDLDDFAGAERFMLEWRVTTDGPRPEFHYTAPTSCVASGQRGVRFHTTVTADLARFIDDVIEWHMFTIEPDVSHSFRVDFYGNEWFEWAVDGEVLVAKRLAKPYPTADSIIQWGVRAACFDNVSAFDYVRFGIPDEPEVDCEAISQFKTSCKQAKIKAKLKSALEPGTELTLTNNGDHRVMRVKPNGKAKAKYKRQTGEHTLLLLNCPAISQELTCD